jgi:hypothetical protein
MGDNSRRNTNLNLLIGHPFSPSTLLYPAQQVYRINLKLQYQVTNTFTLGKSILKS